MQEQLPKIYEPKSIEAEAQALWVRGNYFHADAKAASSRGTYTIVIPPPNVTAALHLGHALNNTLQDILIRWRRMQGFNTLWMPGTDHAGIATQTVVEKRLLAEQGKRRTDFAREDFVARVQAWKDEYEACILGQLKAMGCSCDWPRTRFTMDEVCAKAVRANFFKLFADGLIYRGKRLVNWDPATQTVLADDEVEHETVQGNFWYLRYPLAEPVTIESGTAFQAVGACAPAGTSGVDVTEGNHGQDARATETLGDRGTAFQAVGACAPAGTSGVDVTEGNHGQDARATETLGDRGTAFQAVDSAVHKRHGAYLPHWTKAGATYVVTFRLADSLPEEVMARWRVERKRVLQQAEAQARELTQHEQEEIAHLFSECVESYLDAGHGQCVLQDPRVAEIVASALKYFDGQRYDLIAWAIMPNHVHAVLGPCGGTELRDILHSWKSYTANRANQVLGKTGEFWQAEYFDHLIRDEEDFLRQVNYVLANPSRAGLHDWPWVGVRRDDRGQDRGTAFQAVGALAPAKTTGINVTDGNHGQDAHATEHGQDAHATEHGQDAHATEHGQDAHATEHGQDAHATEHGQDAHATNTGRMPVPHVITYVTVATTRPETMLGDTAVAMNPADPRAKALVGKMVRLPIVGRLIPIVADEHVVLPNPESEDEKARFSTGFLKVTPAHDPDDWQIGQRHGLPVINVMGPDGSISERYGWTDWEEIANPDVENLLGMDRFEAREAIVEWFRTEGLLEDVRPYVHEVGHSYRSHVPIEPYLSDQWYIAVKKPIDHLAAKFGDGLIEGMDVPVNSLAGLALKPLMDGRLRFIPERYAKTYQTWLENLRDWPISRQLWWGHQIPVWSRPGRHENRCKDGTCSIVRQTDQGTVTYACVRPGFEELEKAMESEGWVRDGDVLDTWFSSALWPFSTLGWPDETPEMNAFYPGDVLCTAREIITLWVSRMVMMGQYCAGDIPFKDVYIHAMIQDGQGRKMSKSLGNGIDPLVAIDSHGADAMRFTLASMTTDTQDIRMPVAEMVLPDGRTANTSPKFDIGRNFCNKLWNASRFAMMNLEGTDPARFDAAAMDITDRWILSRLTRTVQEATEGLAEFKYNEPLNAIYRFFWNDLCDWYLEWVKPRMQQGGTAFQAVEGGKVEGREKHGQDAHATAQNVLAFVLDQTLRLLHPFIPFITEGIFQKLNDIAPVRKLNGLAGAPAAEALMVAAWPEAMEGLIDEAAEQRISAVQNVIRVIRDIRSQHNVPPSKMLNASASASEATAAVLRANADLVRTLAGIEQLTVGTDIERITDAAAAIVEDIQIYVHGVVDRQAESQRLEKQKQQLANGIGPLRAKLSNANFIARARPEVVEQSRQRLAELTEQLAAVEANLKQLNEE